MKSLQIAGRAIAVLTGIALLITSGYLLIKGKPEQVILPALLSGVLGYMIIRPGKRSAKITAGGVVMEVTSDDTGAFRTYNSAVAQIAVDRITHEISEKTLLDIRNESTTNK